MGHALQGRNVIKLQDTDSIDVCSFSFPLRMVLKLNASAELMRRAVGAEYHAKPAPHGARHSRCQMLTLQKAARHDNMLIELVGTKPGTAVILRDSWEQCPDNMQNVQAAATTSKHLNFMQAAVSRQLEA